MEPTNPKNTVLSPPKIVPFISLFNVNRNSQSKNTSKVCVEAAQIIFTLWSKPSSMLLLVLVGGTGPTKLFGLEWDALPLIIIDK